MHKTPSSRYPRRFTAKDYAAVFCLAMVGVTPSSQAATDTWTGATSGAWDTTTSNWLNDGIDTLFNSGNDALFTGTPVNDVASAADLSIGSITLNNTFTGSVTLTGNNTVTGTTTISGGTLKITHLGTATGTVAATDLGTSAISLNTGGLLYIDDDGTGAAGAERIVSIANSISGSGTLQARPSAAHTNGWSSVNFSGDLSGFTGTLNILPGSTGNRGKVRFTSASQATVLSSSATVDIQSGATLYLNQARNYGAALRLFGTGNTEGLGALRIDSSANQTGTVRLLANSNIGVNGSAATISGNIVESGGSFGFTKVGSSTLTLTGSNSYSGGTTISAATVSVGGTSALGTGGVTMSNGTTLSTATGGATVANNFTLNGGTTFTAGNGTLALNGSITGSPTGGSWTLNPTNKITLAGANNVTMSANFGSFIVNAGAGGVDITGATVINGAAGNTFSGYASVNSTVTVQPGASFSFNGTSNASKPNSIIGQNFTGIGSLVVNGGDLSVGTETGLAFGNNTPNATGVLTIASGSATILRGSTDVTDARSFIALGRDTANGVVNLNGGTLATDRNFVRDSSAGADVAGTANFVFNGGTLKALASQTDWLNSSTKNTNQLALTSVTTGSSGAISTIDPNGFSVAINNNVTGTGGFEVNSTTNTGTVTLAGENSYTGNTTVTDGALDVANLAGAGTGLGNLSVGVSGTIGGTGRIAPGADSGISISGALAPGALPSGIGTLTIDLGGTTGKSTMLGGAELQVELGTSNPSLGSISAGSSDTLAFAGATAGDFAFNATKINFLGTGSEGYYKLFDTSFDATTWTGLTFNSTSGIVTAGLSAINLAPGLAAQFVVGTAGNGADSVGDIYVHVVPEPSTSLVLVAGAGILGLARRSRGGYASRLSRAARSTDRS